MVKCPLRDGLVCSVDAKPREEAAWHSYALLITLSKHLKFLRQPHLRGALEGRAGGLGGDPQASSTLPRKPFIPDN